MSAPAAFESTAQFARGEVLGVGSFCSVLRCTDRASGLQYAMKTVPKRRSPLDQACVMEAHCLRRLCRSPAVVRLLFEADGDLEWIGILELCDQGELWTHVQRCGCVLEGEPAWFASQMVDALACVHAAGIVHRDLKCENFMLTGAWQSARGGVGRVVLRSAHSIMVPHARGTTTRTSSNGYAMRTSDISPLPHQPL